MAKSNKKKAARSKVVKPKRRSTSRSTKKGRRPEAKPKSAVVPVDPSTVRLATGKGSANRGGGPGGHYWHIYAGEKRAGHVYINLIDEPPFGKHASIHIFINKTLRGRGIGKVAYRLACEHSQHDVVIAHMRKNNIASQRAAKAAGFEVVDDDKIAQLAMRWTRSSPTKSE